jgi:DNA-binding PadR family transcriptional regulator
MELSKTAYVILGTLRLGQRTGYDIKSLVDVSTRFFWAASYGQIYPELRRLEKAGLVKGERDPQNGRRRKAYELTPEGERALHAWLVSDDPLHFELRHEGLLKLFFSDALSSEEAAAQIRRLRAEHERILSELRTIEPHARAKQEEGDKRFPLMTLEFGIAYQQFLIDYCSEMEQRLVAGTGASGS